MSTFQERWYLHATETAVFRGVPYRAGGSKRIAPLISLIRESDDPVPQGLPLYEPGDRVYLVHPDRLDAWYRPRWTFRWRGEPFDAIGSRGGKISGMYRGGNGRFANEFLTRVEAVVYECHVPLDEITDLTEHRTDLLAQWREKQGG